MATEQEYMDVMSKQRKSIIGDLNSRKYYLKEVISVCDKTIVEAQTRRECSIKEMDFLDAVERNVEANYKKFTQSLTEQAQKEVDELKLQKGVK